VIPQGSSEIAVFKPVRFGIDRGGVSQRIGFRAEDFVCAGIPGLKKEDKAVPAQPRKGKRRTRPISLCKVLAFKTFAKRITSFFSARLSLFVLRAFEKLSIQHGWSNDCTATINHQVQSGQWNDWVIRRTCGSAFEESKTK
jgi:hypothetical protein